MDANETLNTIAALPVYVLIFVGIMAFLWVMHRQSLGSAVQAEAIRQALGIAAAGQQEANRLRDETNKQNERWMHMMETMNERFIMSISGQTGVMNRHATRLDTIDSSLTSLPALATGAAVSAVSDKVSIGLEILKLLGVDVGELAKHASHPTAASKDKVDEIAGKAEQKTPASAAPTPATPKVGDEIPVTGEVTGVVKLTATADTPA